MIFGYSNAYALGEGIVEFPTFPFVPKEKPVVDIGIILYGTTAGAATTIEGSAGPGGFSVAESDLLLEGGGALELESGGNLELG